MLGVEVRLHKRRSPVPAPLVKPRLQAFHKRGLFFLQHVLQLKLVERDIYRFPATKSEQRAVVRVAAAAGGGGLEGCGREGEGGGVEGAGEASSLRCFRNESHRRRRMCVLACEGLAGNLFRRDRVMLV